MARVTHKVVVVDCDHESLDIERDLAAQRGIELESAQCRTEDEVIAAAADADAVLVQYAPITARVLDRLPAVRAIGRYGVGIDTIDVAAATARGVAVSNVPDYGTEDVSDHALALALALSRGLIELDRGIRAGSHDQVPAKPLHRFATRVFGIVGLGLIGRAAGRKAAVLGFTVIGCDPCQVPGTRTSEGFEVVSFDDVLRRSDVLSLHVPLGPDTHHLIDADALAAMKPTAVLVNTCRGGVVDTAALVAALTTGGLKAAGLDVLEEDPVPADHPIARLDNVILTPHIAWYSEESYGELKYRTLENVADVLAGRRPRNILNPEVLAGLEI
ncbi:C-terminal binding protein [Tsukamurella soli]|uniref:C-terminal binding protein n=1 Tax=Tsukamurella soli TaxID=644556 RepID=A0ABP8JV00_9ACTN